MIRFDFSRKTIRPLVAAVGLSALLAGGCTSVQRNGISPAYLIIDALNASTGQKANEFNGTLFSDVITMVSVGGVDVPTIFNDNGKVTFSLGLKDPGTGSQSTVPTTANTITVTRYHVEFVRSDGRNTQGVDVPYAFDGGMTISVGTSGAESTFLLVRHQAKEEAPLRALANSGGALFISTIAEVTFYGTDQAGRQVTVTGKISVNFGDFGDPKS